MLNLLSFTVYIHTCVIYDVNMTYTCNVDMTLPPTLSGLKKLDLVKFSSGWLQ